MSVTMSESPHTPASSESDVLASTSGEPLSSPPSEGDTQGATMLIEALRAGDEGIEEVAGYQRAEAAASDLWTPPTADLPDVGEASFGPLPPLCQGEVRQVLLLDY